MKWAVWGSLIALTVTLITVLLLGHFLGHWFDSSKSGNSSKVPTPGGSEAPTPGISQGPPISLSPLDDPIYASTTDFGFGAQTACGCNGDAVVKELEKIGWAGMATPVWMGTPYLNAIPTPVVQGGDSCSASELVGEDEPRNCSIGSGGCASCWKLTPTGEANIYGVTPEASEISSVYGIVLDGCEASNSYGNNTQWCVPYKGIPEGGIDLSGEDCPNLCCSDDANPILKSKYDAEQVFGNWTQSDKLFQWNAPECYDADGNWTCTNVAGYGYHFDFATQDLGDKAPWKPGTNPIVEAEKVECPEEVMDILISKCGKNSETSGPFDCNSYCNGNRPDWWGGCTPVCPDDDGCVGCTGEYPGSEYIKEWEECTPPEDKKCCPGTECIGDDNYSQCKPVENFTMVSCGVIALFKNEEDIILEWLTHYRKEGVTEFILIDNGSIDNGVDLVANEPDVTVVQDLRVPFDENGPGQQEQMYNDVLSLSKSDWIIVCDLDEFIYSRNGYPTIIDFLAEVPASVGQIYVEWQLFGSNWYIEQPKSVIKSFTKRAGLQNIGKIIEDEEISTPWGSSKAIVRRSVLKRLGVHNHKIKSNYVTIESNGLPILPRTDKERKPNKYYTFYADKSPILSDYALQLNHYRVQSLNKFTKNRSFRDFEYFLKHDHNNDDDYELANKEYNA